MSELKPCARLKDCTTPALCGSVGTCKGRHILPKSIRQEMNAESSSAKFIFMNAAGDFSYFINGDPESILAELVACKDMKDRLDTMCAGGGEDDLTDAEIEAAGDEFDRLHDEYHSRKTLVWAAAREYFKNQKVADRQPEIPLNGHCAAGTDGDCFHSDCPQTRDGEPHKLGRSCPLIQYSDED